MSFRVSRSLLVAALAALALAATGAPAWAQDGSGGQTPITTSPVVTPPSVGFPLLVLTNRNIRMTLAGIVGERIGCFGRPEEACFGTLRLSLGTPINVGNRRVAPLYMGGVAFVLTGGAARFLRIRVFPRARFLVRQRGQVPLTITGSWNSRSGRHGFTRRVVMLYVPAFQVIGAR